MNPKKYRLYYAIILVVLSLLLMSCDRNDPTSKKLSLAEKSTMYAAINVGYSLGYLASTYATWIPNYSNTDMARENYTLLVQSNVEFLGGTLSPSPTQLLKSGRGNNQYAEIESYFGQITKLAEKHSQCIRPVIGMSLASGWLILNTFEAEKLFVSQNVNADLLRDFKNHFTSRLSMFSTLAGTAGVLCEEKQYPKMLSKMFQAIHEDSWAWKERINSSKSNEIISELRIFRNEMDLWINGAMRIVGPNP